MIRTTPVAYGTTPYDWNSPYKWNCSWYVYYRCAEKGLPYACYYDRPTRTGTYTDAKEWLKNYREPWEVKGIDYVPVENDIVVFNGTYGHVAFIEKVENGRALLSQYMSGKEDSFSNYSWQIGTSYTGALLGYLHCPYSTVDPVSRNTEVDQIQTTDDTLRIRTNPTLNSEVVGHVQLGYYNVSSKKQSDGYTWYQIAKNRWCADITTKYFPASQEEDVMKIIEDYFNSLKGEINKLTEKDKTYESKLERIIKICEE